MTTRNTKSSKARNTIRELMAKGFTEQQTLIDAAAEALGGDETDKMIATMVWRRDFCITEAN